mmetsp:Transcript_9408/g.16977  ORF Transcript_9408/g.16977 Transcript_9408/m.16977 type:complete len:84 (-) Transcript_9408:442-693(-)
MRRERIRAQSRLKAARKRARIRIQRQQIEQDYKNVCEENARLKNEIISIQLKLSEVQRMLRNQLPPSEYKNLVLPVLDQTQNE